jgi:hypothetical protein
MKKLGTKGLLLLHYYNGEHRVLFDLLAPFRRKWIFIFGSLRKIQGEETEKRNFVLTKSQPPKVLESLDFA